MTDVAEPIHGERAGFFSPEAIFVLSGISQNIGSILAKSLFGEVEPATVAWIRVSFAAIRTETAANRPVATRVGWRSGGGHVQVVHGYDTSGDWVFWSDPGPAKRYNWSTYGFYAQNPAFTWTHTLTGIAR